MDGKPRYQGVKSFLESRGIDLPLGDPSDPPDRETICGLGNRKQELFGRLLESEEVLVFESTLNMIRELRERGAKVGMVSSSKNCVSILEAASIDHLFDAVVDEIVSSQHGLKGKPDPDAFLKVLEWLGERISGPVDHGSFL